MIDSEDRHKFRLERAPGGRQTLIEFDDLGGSGCWITTNFEDRQSVVAEDNLIMIGCNNMEQRQSIQIVLNAKMGESMANVIQRWIYTGRIWKRDKGLITI